MYQLTREQRTGTLPYDKNYTYDKVGNRLTMVVGETTTYYHHDSANKLNDYGASDTPPYTGNTFLDYDDAGNLLTETPPAGSATSYTYNWQNRMTEIEVGTETIAQFAYDGEGVRCSATFDSGTTLFRYDTGDLIAELDGQGALEAFYQLGPGGASSRQTASMAYYHADGLGSVKATSSAQSAVTDSYTYDAWGNELAHFGSTQQPYEFVGALGYYTHYQESSVSLLQLGVRFYDPEIGRFTQRDAFYDEKSRYAYATDNPVANVDPTGYKAEDWVKKGKACVKKCVVKCGTDSVGEDEPDKCFRKCLADCMGKAFGQGLCETILCEIVPDQPFCDHGNPCAKNQNDVYFCQNCCKVKFYCCVVTKGWKGIGACLGCELKYGKGCFTECNAKCGDKPKGE